MILARVEGSAVSTIKHPSLTGWRLLVCQLLDENEQPEGGYVLSLDSLGAGMHQTVVLSSDGKSVREKVGDQYSPARYMTLGIVDERKEDETAEAAE